MSPWIILDRDGVINQDSEHYIRSPEEWIPLPKSLEAIALLNKKGYHVTVATNQSGIARKYYDINTLCQIHQKMIDAVQQAGGKIAGIFLCPHGPDLPCDCRKPLPGLLHQIAAQFDISLDQVPFVGDSYRDLQAALNANAQPVLVLTGNGQKTWETHKDALQQTPRFDDLWAFAEAQPTWKPQS